MKVKIKDDFLPADSRVVVFIDGSNCYHSIKELFDIHDNVTIGASGFEKIIKEIVGNRVLIGVYYYNASLDRGFNEEVYWKQQKFFSDLRKLPGWHVVMCRMKKDTSSKEPVYVVKGDDINIATDMVGLAYENAYDIAILVSGDGDFVPAIKRVQKLGKNVENAYFSISRSDFLKSVSNASLKLDDIVERELESVQQAAVEAEKNKETQCR